MAEQNAAQTNTEAADGNAQAESATTLLNGGEQAPATTEGDKPDESADAKPADVVPEKYEFTLPEGFVLDEQVLEQATPILKEIGLTNEKAQKVANLFAQIRQSEAQAMQQSIEKQQSDWIKSVESDKEFGGANFKANIQIARQGLSQFATPELRQFLEDTGLGSHPEVVRLCYRVGKALAEDKTPNANNTAGGTEKTAAQVLYG